MSRTPTLGLSLVILSAFLLNSLVAQTPQQPARPSPKRVLAWGDTLTAFQHDSISHPLATMERLGRESGAYEMYIRTDSQLLTKQPVPAPARNTRNLIYFDAISYYRTGDNLNAQQKKDLMSFIQEASRGFIAAPTGDDAFFFWFEFLEMIGGYFDGHPWNSFDAPIIIEDPTFPARFTIKDEIYQHKDFSRAKIRVLAGLDSTKLDYTKPNIHRDDKDFPVAPKPGTTRKSRRCTSKPSAGPPADRRRRHPRQRHAAQVSRLAYIQFSDSRLTMEVGCPDADSGGGR
ncbi:MAG: ThuA domain-containing protein [Candidatus Solibacter sp.]|nr:ThuA domain-containing protein [Candidatus Solibacter sp.]